MKVSEFLKKVGYIDRAEILIEFKADKSDADPDVIHMDADTPEELKEQIIRRAAGYTLQEVNFIVNAVMITGIKRKNLGLNVRSLHRQLRLCPLITIIEITGRFW